MRVLRDGAGTAFDPACVAALAASLDQVTGAEPAIPRTPVAGLQ